MDSFRGPRWFLLKGVEGANAKHGNREYAGVAVLFSLSFLSLSLFLHYIFTLSLPDPVGFISKVKGVASVLMVRITVRETSGFSIGYSKSVINYDPHDIHVNANIKLLSSSNGESYFVCLPCFF